MARVPLTYVAEGERGNKLFTIPGATVTILEADGVTLLAQSLWSAPSGGVAQVNPTTTGANGATATFWLDTAQTLVISWVAPGWAQQTETLSVGAGGTGGGGTGTPSGTVVSETSYGQVASAGATSDYSRGDHTHGTPVALTPAFSVVTETTYSQASAAGGASTFSRGDHTHGTQALPTPAAIGAAVTAHTHTQDVAVMCILTAPVVGDQATAYRADEATTITKIAVKLVGGTSVSVQVTKNINGANVTLLASVLVNSTAGTWVATTTLQNASLVTDDDLTVQLTAVSGNPSEVDVRLYATESIS